MGQVDLRSTFPAGQVGKNLNVGPWWRNFYARKGIVVYLTILANMLCFQNALLLLLPQWILCWVFFFAFLFFLLL